MFRMIQKNTGRAAIVFAIFILVSYYVRLEVMATMVGVLIVVGVSAALFTLVENFRRRSDAPNY